MRGVFLITVVLLASCGSSNSPVAAGASAKQDAARTANTAQVAYPDLVLGELLIIASIPQLIQS